MMRMESSGQTRTEQDGRYEGYQGYSEPGGEIPSLSSPYDDGAPPQQFAQQPLWQVATKLQSGLRGRITPAQRLILAIVSVIMIALFSMIVLTSTQQSFTGLIGVGIMCAAIFLVNVAFSWRWE